MFCEGVRGKLPQSENATRETEDARQSERMSHIKPTSCPRTTSCRCSVLPPSPSSLPTDLPISLMPSQDSAPSPGKSSPSPWPYRMAQCLPQARLEGVQARL